MINGQIRLFSSHSRKKKSNHVALIVIIIGKTQNPFSPIFLELRVVGYRLAIFLLGV